MVDSEEKSTKQTTVVYFFGFVRKQQRTETNLTQNTIKPKVTKNPKKKQTNNLRYQRPRIRVGSIRCARSTKTKTTEPKPEIQEAENSQTSCFLFFFFYPGILYPGDLFRVFISQSHTYTNHDKRVPQHFIDTTIPVDCMVQPTFSLSNDLFRFFFSTTPNSRKSATFLKSKTSFPP